MKRIGFSKLEILGITVIVLVILGLVSLLIWSGLKDTLKSRGLTEAKLILSGINNYCAQAKYKEQLNSSNKDICKDGILIEEVSQMFNLGNAEILKITYTNNKVEELVVKSNTFVYTLQDNEFIY